MAGSTTTKQNIVNSQIPVVKPFEKEINLPNSYINLERVGRLKKLDVLLKGLKEEFKKILGLSDVTNPPIKILLNFEYKNLTEDNKKPLDDNYKKFKEQIMSLDKLLRDIYNHPSFYKTEEREKLEVLSQKMINNIKQFVLNPKKELIERVRKDIEDLQKKINNISENRKMVDSADLKYELESKIGNLIKDAHSELTHDWDKVENKGLGSNIFSGKKAQLINYLKKIYGDNDPVLLNLEKETNPEEFSKEAQDLNIEGIAENAIKRYIDAEEKFNEVISDIINVRRNFLNDIIGANRDENEIEKIKRKFEKKYIKNKPFGGMNSEKEKWVRKMLKIYRSYGFIGDKGGEKILIKDLEDAYDIAFKLDENNIFANNSLDDINQLQSDFKSLLNKKYLLGIDPKNKLNSISYVNQDQSQALNKKSESYGIFNSYGIEVGIKGENDAKLPWNRTFWYKKICKDQDGKNVSLMALRDRGDVIIREDIDSNNSSFKVYVNNNVNVPLNVLTSSTILKRQKPISIYHHDKNGTMHESTIIHREIRKNPQNIDTNVTIYELTEGSYLTGTELNLDRVPGIRVGLIAEQKPKVDTKNEQIKNKDGNLIMETIYTLSILSAQDPLSDKTKNEIKTRYGDRIFKGPDGVEIKIEEMLKKNMVTKKDPYQKPAKPQTLEEREAEQRKEDIKKAFKDGLEKTKKKVKEEIKEKKAIAKMFIGAPKRKIEEIVEKNKEAKRKKIEGFKNSFNDARQSLIDRFDLSNQLNTWTPFKVSQDSRKDANTNLLVVTREYYLGIGNNSLTEKGDLDLFGQYYDLRENLVNLNKMMDDVNFRKLPKELQKQIKEKIIEINDFISRDDDIPRNNIFSNPEALQGVILIKKEDIIYDNDKKNKPFDLQLHEIRKGKIENLNQGNHTDAASGVVKFKQEVKLINDLINNLINNPDNAKKVAKLQNYLNKELNEDYNQLNGKWKKRSQGVHTNREVNRTRSGSNLSRGGGRNNTFNRTIISNDDL